MGTAGLARLPRSKDDFREAVSSLTPERIITRVSYLMRVSAFLTLVLLLLFPISSSCPARSINLPHNANVEICFSPQGECTDASIKEIKLAKTEILIQSYSFTSAPIAKALVIAHKKGAKVQAILDKSQRSTKYTSATFLANAEIPIFIDDKHAIAHNKIMIIDRAVVITRSFNFTRAAEQKNAENLLIIITFS
jgi:phosphatidylserine/phosphatidylglycerophosphate/cardiolipin synthase-like enzyme